MDAPRNARLRLLNMSILATHLVRIWYSSGTLADPINCRQTPSSALKARHVTP
jgi:hypothetical protein